ncbi:TlpA family protein disulfide reductase [bacterium]|nr:TlpA family protein disulfide reductase [bacterium]
MGNMVTRYLVALIALLAIGFTYTAALAATCPLDLGSSAPSLLGTDLEGQYQELTSYRGKWVYIDFWATWCQPCMRKLPDVVNLHRQSTERNDLVVLSVSLDQAGNESQINNVAEQLGIRFPVIYDGQGWFSKNVQDWCVEAIPATFLVAPDGKLIARNIDAGNVEQFINHAANNNYIPLQIKTAEKLSRNSPTSGRSGFKDFTVSVDIHPNSPPVSRYRMDILYTFNSPHGHEITHVAAYNILVSQELASSEFPFRVYLEKTTPDLLGNIWLRFTDEDFQQIPRPDDLPALSVMVNLTERAYDFTLALPGDCSRIAYGISLYDEQMQQYLCNGIRMMEKPAR